MLNPIDDLLALETPLKDEPWHRDPRDRDPRSEFQRQTAFLREAAKLCPAVSIFAVPNSSRATDWERIRRWKEGARAGIPDLIATWNRGVAFMEFKDGQGQPSTAQRERLNLFYRQGHHCGVFRQERTALAFLFERGAPFLVRPPGA